MDAKTALDKADQVLHLATNLYEGALRVGYKHSDAITFCLNLAEQFIDAHEAWLKRKVETERAQQQTPAQHLAQP